MEAYHGIVEPISAIATIFISSIITTLLPYLLAFAAGAMIYVITEELIPTSHENKKIAKLATFSLIIGFIIMMNLDVIF